MQVYELALPVAAIRGVNANVGTAFIVATQGKRYIVTAAHIGQQRQPTQAWDTWPEAFKIFPFDTASVSVPLFTDTDGGRKPRFYFAEGNTPGSLADLLVLDLDDIPECAAFMQARSVQGDLPVREPAPGEPITVSGFPGLKDDRWPYAPPSTATGPYVGVIDTLYAARIPVEVGHSGGPVTTQAGDVIGMLIGSTDDTSRIVPIQFIVQFIALFRSLMLRR